VRRPGGTSPVPSRRPGLGILLLVVALVPSLGCSMARDDERYFFSFGHLVPDQAPIDVFLDGQPFEEGLTAGTVTGYQELRALPDRIAVRLSGSGELVAGPEPPAPIPPGGQQSVLLVGRVADGTVSLLLYNHAKGSPKASRQRLVLAHAAPDVGPTEFVVNGDVKGRRIDFLEAGSVSGAPAGLVQVQARRIEASLKLVGTRAYELEGGRDYSLLLDGRLGDDTLDGFLFEDATGIFFPPASRLRFVNTVPGFDELDFLIDGAAVFPGVRFGRSERYLPIRPGTYRVTIADPDTGEAVGDLGDVPLLSGQDATVVARGVAPGSDETDGLAFLDPDLPAVFDTARVRFLHVAVGVGPLRVVVGGETVIASGAPFASIGSYERVTSGAQTFRVEDALTGELIVPDRNFRLRNGRDFTVALVGVLDGDPPPTLVRLDDDIDP